MTRKNFPLFGRAFALFTLTLLVSIADFSAADEAESNAGIVRLKKLQTAAPYFMG
jgi:hypothetical protein